MRYAVITLALTALVVMGCGKKAVETQSMTGKEPPKEQGTPPPPPGSK